MPRFKRPKPTTVVLGLLCVMYLITYVDRVNISTAADSIKRELALSNTQLGFLQSAFGYPYLIFQIFGGWIGDRFGPRRTLFLCGLVWATATILTGFAGGLTSLFLCRLLVGIGEGATFPGGDARDAELDAGRPPRLRAGADARVRAARQRDHAADRRVADRHDLVARIVRRARLLQPGLGADLALVLPRHAGRASRRSRARSSRRLPNHGAPAHDRAAARAVGRADAAHGAGDDRLLLLRLDAVALPDVAAVVLPARVPVRPAEVGAVHVGGVLRGGGRRLSRRRDQRPHPAPHRRPAEGAPQRRDVRLPRIVRLPGAGLPDARPRRDHPVARRARSSSPRSSSARCGRSRWTSPASSPAPRRA